MTSQEPADRSEHSTHEKQDENPIRVLYARVSSAQNPTQGLHDQIKQINARAEEMGTEVVDDD